MIEFHNVAVCYEPDKRHPIRSLDGLTLKIARGDWAFLVGPSGAGKSSLMKLIFADLRVQSGQVIVDGEDISRISDAGIPALRRKIGIVFQDYQLLSQKTAWENVAFALRVIGTPQAQILREVPRALETVGLSHRAEAFPHQLSGGEQQRIAIARAIVNDPVILLADEPTGNLDPQTAREVGQLLTKINRERGTTIVMATHDGAFVDAIKRRVVRLKDGRVISDQNPGQYAETDAATRDHFFNSPANQAPIRESAPPLQAPESADIRAETTAPNRAAVAREVEKTISREAITEAPTKPESAPAFPANNIWEAAPKRAEISAPPPETTAPSFSRPRSAASNIVATNAASSNAATPETALRQVAASQNSAPNAVSPNAVSPQNAASQNAVAPEVKTPVPPAAPPVYVAGLEAEIDDFPPAPRPMARRLSPEELLAREQK